MDNPFRQRISSRPTFRGSFAIISALAIILILVSPSGYAQRAKEEGSRPRLRSSFDIPPETERRVVTVFRRALRSAATSDIETLVDTFVSADRDRIGSVVGEDFIPVVRNAKEFREKWYNRYNFHYVESLEESEIPYRIQYLSSTDQVSLQIPAGERKLILHLQNQGVINPEWRINIPDYHAEELREVLTRSTREAGQIPLPNNPETVHPLIAITLLGPFTAYPEGPQRAGRQVPAIP